MSDNSDTDSDNDEKSIQTIITNANQWQIVGITVAAVTNYYLQHVHKEAKRTSSLSRHAWVEELKQGNDNQFF